MKWIMLLIAGMTEVTWAVAMKAAEGFTKTVPSVITVVGYVLSAVFLSMALKELPLGTAYAMWTGFGIVGTAVLGVLLFEFQHDELLKVFHSSGRAGGIIVSEEPIRKDAERSAKNRGTFCVFIFIRSRRSSVPRFL